MSSIIPQPARPVNSGLASLDLGLLAADLAIVVHSAAGADCRLRLLATTRSQVVAALDATPSPDAALARAVDMLDAARAEIIWPRATSAQLGGAA
ncbi:hypothetical protein [Streptomyces sp. SCA2-2]|uniref:hypothetical protein n=1 Tax=Streptomyces sp. SCA2-2 TaxID=1563677 RepID=UPI00101FBEB8|nr:hypothetical protein [Streptomyces sp. SCA2-2]RZE89143.1 hypothetical protein C0L86_28740 [Streptomyces sp. SCA2-2]